MNRKRLFFYITLSLYIMIIFIGNYNHRTQQGIYSHRHLVLAENLLNGIGYTYSLEDTEPAFYPLWGYPLLVALGVMTGHPIMLLLTFQYLLCIVGIFTFYKLFEIKENFWHIPLFLPFIAVLSVKWTDAIVAFLLIMYVYFSYLCLKQNKIVFYIFAGLMLGFIHNFRSEYLFLPLLQSFMILLPHFRSRRKIYLYYILFTCIVSIMCLLPWALRSYSYDSQLRFTSTNGGMVLYISLGQLPESPWNIEHQDEYAYKYVLSMGEEKASSINGNKLLKEKFLNLVEQHPFSFVKKVAYNFLRSLFSGVYIGEYKFLSITKERMNEIQLLRKEGVMKKFLNLNIKELIYFLSIAILHRLFFIIFFLMIISFIYISFIYRDKEKALLLGLLISVIVYKFALVSLIQYEPRHMNAVYLILYGATILMFLIRRKWPLKW